MASQRVEARLRIAGGLLIIGLAIISLIMIWGQPPDAFTGIAISVAAAGAVVLGATIVVGRTRAGRMVLTRRRWKYGLLIGYIVVVILAAVFLNRAGSNPGLPLFLIGMGVFVAQLFEPEATAASPLAVLSDRDVRTWMRIALVTACVGVVLCCISVVVATTGNLLLVSLLLPVAILSLIFAAGIWVWLRSTKRPTKGNR